MKILTISGQAQHGKDATASILSNYFGQRGKKCLIIRYGDYLKFIAKMYYGWDGEKDYNGRNLLQQLGTEKGRDNNPDIWVNVVAEFIKTFGRDYDYIIIPDTRYPNEILRLEEEGYDVFTIYVHRKNFENNLTKEQRNHRSETSLLDYNFDYMISVENEIYKLSDAIQKMIDKYEEF